MGDDSGVRGNPKSAEETKRQVGPPVSGEIMQPGAPCYAASVRRIRGSNYGPPAISSLPASQNPVPRLGQQRKTKPERDLKGAASRPNLPMVVRTAMHLPSRTAGPGEREPVPATR